MKYFVGWDVGAWNCSRKSSSQDALVVLHAESETPQLSGRVFRGPLRTEIAEIKSFPNLLKTLTGLEAQPNDEFVIGIDTPLGLPEAVQWHVTGKGLPDTVVKQASHNPYLYRKCEQHLAESCFPPLSAIKDMIGSQSTKGIHFLRKLGLKPQEETVGVWRNETVTAIECYPATCKRSERKGYICHGSEFVQEVFCKLLNGKHEIATYDEEDAIYCALVAYLFATAPDKLVSPTDDVPSSEGWIWYPKDSIGRKSNKKSACP